MTAPYAHMLSVTFRRIGARAVNADYHQDVV